MKQLLKWRGWVRSASFIGLTSLLCLWSGQAQAAAVSAQQAETLVNKWLAADNDPMDAKLSSTIGEVMLYPGDGLTNAFYVVSMQPEGYVIVAADDRAGSVLAFSVKGAFDPSPDSPLYRMLQRDVPVRVANAQIQAVQATRVPQAAKGVPSAKSTTTASPVTSLAVDHPLPAKDEICRVRVAPLLQSHWAQGYASSTEPIFNYYTPSNAAAGNVAMCLAQIIRHHRYQPAGGVGVKPYLASVNETPTWLHTRGGDGKGGQYIWDDMVDDPLATTLTLAQRQAIGSLCADVGISLTEADYDVRHGTEDRVWFASDLRKVFGYAQGGVVGLYDGKDPLWNGDELLGEWAGPTNNAFRMINANLDAGLPVMLVLEPENPKKDDMAVDCDGYGYSRTEELGPWMFHHLNMSGGSKSEDIWYTLPIVPAGIGFTNIFGIIYNIMPTNVGEVVSGRVVDQSGISMPGVTMQITDGGAYTKTTRTGVKGIYSFIVPANKTYTISVFPPVGSSSTPSHRDVTVGESVNGGLCGNVWGQNFEVPSHLIMGQILKDGKPMGGAQVDFSSFLTVTTDNDGWFLQPVPNHWFGNLVPWLSIGGSFDPSSNILVDVTADITNLVFNWTAPTMCAIAGTVFDEYGSPISNAELSFSGSGLNMSVTTLDTGDYLGFVPIGWSGSMTVSHPDGGVFYYWQDDVPIYTNVVNYSNLVADTFQSFFWIEPTISAVSGRVTHQVTGKPVAGVVLTSCGNSFETTTDANGAYTFTVPYKWSGTITASHPRGGSFRPSASRSYSSVNTYISGANYQWMPPPPTLNGLVVRADAPYGPVVGATITVTFDVGGTPQSVKTKDDGSYSLELPYLWKGTITPSHAAGGFFNPTSDVARVSSLLEDPLVQNFSWTPPLQAITGRITRAGSTTPVSGATVLFVSQIYIAGTYGSPYTPLVNGGTDMPVQTDTNGVYSLVVPYGWTGVLIASHPRGGGFAPITHTWFNMSAMAINCLVTNFNLNIADLTAFNFFWTPPQPSICGHVYRGDGDYGTVGGVTIAFDGGYSVITADDGSYSNSLPFGWSGSATPSHPAGGAFDPTNMPFLDTTASDQVTQNYRWYPPMQSISGCITRVDNGLPVAGVSVTFSNATGLSAVPVINRGASVTVTTDSNGLYGLIVPYGWSGSSTPTHPYGGAFIPAQYAIIALSGSRYGDNFTWSPPPPAVAGRVIRSDTGAGVAGLTLIFSNAAALVTAGATNPLAVVTTDASGYYRVGVGFAWSGTITPRLTGEAEIDVVPGYRAFTNVLEDVVATNLTQFVYTPFLQILGGEDGTLDFGKVMVSKSLTRSVVIINNSRNACKVMGALPPDYFQVTPSVYTLNPGATKVLQVIFRPPAAVLFTGAVLWATQPQPLSGFPSIQVRGVGQQLPDVLQGNGDLDFGTLFVGQRASRTFTLTNGAQQALQISGRWANGTDFSVKGLPVTLAAGKSAAFTIGFAPRTSKNYGGAMLTLTAKGLPQTVSLSPRSTVISDVSGTWTALLNKKNYTLYVTQNVATVDGKLVCAQNLSVNDQYLAGFILGSLTGKLWATEGAVGQLALTPAGKTLTGKITRHAVGTNLVIKFTRVSSTVPNSVDFDHRPAFLMRSPSLMSWAGKQTDTSDALRILLLNVAPAAQFPDDEDLAAVVIQHGKAVVVSPAQERDPQCALIETELEMVGEDSNTNGVPDFLEAAIGTPLQEGMQLLQVRKQGAYAIPGAVYDGTRVEGEATRLDLLPATWTLRALQP
jgi:hypothetical protein